MKALGRYQIYLTHQVPGRDDDVILDAVDDPLGPESLVYEFTVENPRMWTKPWTVQIPMRRTDGPIYEYACHEGNYGLVNQLAGARAKEKVAEEAASTGSR